MFKMVELLTKPDLTGAIFVATVLVVMFIGTGVLFAKKKIGTGIFLLLFALLVFCAFSNAIFTSGFGHPKELHVSGVYEIRIADLYCPEKINGVVLQIKDRIGVLVLKEGEKFLNPPLYKTVSNEVFASKDLKGLEVGQELSIKLEWVYPPAPYQKIEIKN